MVEHGGSSAGSYLTDPTSPIPSHCASIVATSTVSVTNVRRRDSILRHRYVHCRKSIGDKVPSLTPEEGLSGHLQSPHV